MKRQLTTLGLALFLLLDIVLVYVALRPASRDAPTAGAATAPALAGSSARPTATDPAATSSSSLTASTGGGASLETPAPLAVLIVGFDRSSAWRATVGSCRDGGARVELTSDGGRTWQQAQAPASAVSRIQPLGPRRGFVIASDKTCGPSEYATTDGGATWSGPRDPTGGWSRRLDARNEVLTPSQLKSRPCGDQAVLDLSRTSTDQAEALCLDGSVKVTNDGGKTWGDSGQAPGALAISNRLVSGTLKTYAARFDPAGACKGIQIVTVVKGHDPSAVSCVESKSVAPGQVALSVPSTGGWLLVGDQTWTSGPALTSWTKA